MLLEHAHITLQEFQSIQHNGSLFPGHPLIQRQTNLFFWKPGPNSANAVGQALFCKKKYGQKSPKIAVIIGDGEFSEGVCFEALMLASKYQLDNLVFIVDFNRYQQTVHYLRLAIQ